MRMHCRIDQLRKQSTPILYIHAQSSFTHITPHMHGTESGDTHTHIYTHKHDTPYRLPIQSNPSTQIRSAASTQFKPINNTKKNRTRIDVHISIFLPVLDGKEGSRRQTSVLVILVPRTRTTSISACNTNDSIQSADRYRKEEADIRQPLSSDGK